MTSSIIIIIVALTLIGAALIWLRHRARVRCVSTQPSSFGAQLSQLFKRHRTVEPLLAELESLLLEADVGPRLTDDLIARLRALPKTEQTPDGLKTALKAELSSYVTELPLPSVEDYATPFVFLILGVNGVGKTTTIAKLAHFWKSRGKRVVAIAGDTFRAAAIDQLKVWGDRIGVDVIAQSHGADPGAVLYDGLSAARNRGADVVLVDTAGRLHTKKPLLDELTKLERVMAKFDPNLARQRYLVLDATTGQNGLAQAKVFSEALKIDAAILTKWDGSAKGGVLFAIGRELRLPIAFVGVGESMTDLAPFNVDAFISALFE